MDNNLKKTKEKVNEFKEMTIDEIYHEISEKISQIKQTERKESL